MGSAPEAVAGAPPLTVPALSGSSAAEAVAFLLASWAAGGGQTGSAVVGDVGTRPGWQTAHVPPSPGLADAGDVWRPTKASRAVSPDTRHHSARHNPMLRFKTDRKTERRRLGQGSAALKSPSSWGREGSRPSSLTARSVRPRPRSPALALSQSCSPAASLSTTRPCGSAPATGSTSRWTPAGPASSTPGAGRSPSSSGDTESGCEYSQGPGGSGPRLPQQTACLPPPSCGALAPAPGSGRAVSGGGGGEQAGGTLGGCREEAGPTGACDRAPRLTLVRTCRGPLNEDVFSAQPCLEEKALHPGVQELTEQIHRLLLQVGAPPHAIRPPWKRPVLLRGLGPQFLCLPRPASPCTGAWSPWFG